MRQLCFLATGELNKLKYPGFDNDNKWGEPV